MSSLISNMRSTVVTASRSRMTNLSNNFKPLLSSNNLRFFSTSTSTSSTPSTTPTPSPPPLPKNSTLQKDGTIKNLLYDGEEEILTPEQMEEKKLLIKELTRRLSGPLADAEGNVPTGKNRPIAIEVDGPSHFYANSQRYTAYSKLKHRLLTRMGYKVLHVPYFDWRRLRGSKEREDYMRRKLQEEPSEWLDPEDESYYRQGLRETAKQSGLERNEGVSQSAAA